jgi:hypothetical protein
MLLAGEAIVPDGVKHLDMNIYGNFIKMLLVSTSLNQQKLLSTSKNFSQPAED